MAVKTIMEEQEALCTRKRKLILILQSELVKLYAYVLLTPYYNPPYYNRFFKNSTIFDKIIRLIVSHISMFSERIILDEYKVCNFRRHYPVKGLYPDLAGAL